MQFFKKRHNKLLLIVLLSVLAFLFILDPILDWLLPEREVIQAWMERKGFIGWLGYFLFAITSEFFTPLTFSIPAIAGGFVYGFWLGSLSNIAAKIIGSIIAFYLGKYLGHKILPLFGRKINKEYKKIVKSNAIVYSYALVSVLPFSPGDVMTYFIGASDMKFKTFLIIRVVGAITNGVMLAAMGAFF